MRVLKKDVMDVTGATQLCTGQEAGIEAIIHAMVELFNADDTDAVLLVDATNAFNLLNRKVALHNIRFTCPAISTVLINIYRTPAKLFVVGGTELLSKEGTTQGCVFAMAMYALGTMPLIDSLRSCQVTQAWYADDSQGAGRISCLRKWWDAIQENGPPYGYFPKPSKSFLVVKPKLFEEAKLAFSGTGVHIVDDGKRDLGAAIGSDIFTFKYLKNKVENWTAQLNNLSRIAETQPHAAHAGFIHGVRSKWSFCQRTMSKLSPHMKSLEQVIRTKFLPALLGDTTPISDTERDLYALPARYSGLGIVNPVKDSPHKFNDSLDFTKNLKTLIKSRESKLLLNADDQLKIKSHIKKRKEERLKAEWSSIRSKMPEKMQRAMDFANEKGASYFLTALPLEEQGFTFHSKQDFRDLIRMRYRKRIPNLPSICSCGSPYSLDHSQICKLSGFIHMRHDNVSRLFAFQAKKSFRDVEVEPHLQPLSGEKMRYNSANIKSEARSDVRIRGFWTRQQNAFFDFKVIYPFASSYLSKTPAALYRTAVLAKKRAYEERISSVEHGSFTPMIMTSSGGMCSEMNTAIKHLAQKISIRTNEPYPKVVGVLRCRISFEMFRSALVCLRGSRSIKPKIFDISSEEIQNSSAYVVSEEAKLQ